ncbi:MAG: PAS domain-containing protein [Chitinophagales bacterium]|nr:PAS domain-containing protein [Chitinophagales bacterium]
MTGFILLLLFSVFDKTEFSWLFKASDILIFLCISIMLIILSAKLTTLRHTRTRHILAVDGIAAGIWDWMDVNKEELWWSPRLYELLGYADQEVTASMETFKKILHPDDRERTFDLLRKHLTAGGKYELEFRFLTKSGVYKWFLGTGQASFDKAGKAQRMVGSMINIDLRKISEAAEKEEAALMEVVPDAIILTDLNYVIKTWNPGAEHLYGISAQQAIGKNIREIVETSFPYSTREQVVEKFNADKCWRGESTHLVKSTGKAVHILASVKLLEDEQNNATGILIVNTDLSLLKVNVHLQEAKEDLEQSNHYLQQLAYISAHDLKAPIITVKGLLQRLQHKHSVHPEHRHLLHLAEDTITQMQITNKSLNDILRLRKEIAEKDLDSEKIYVADIMEEVKEILQLDIEESHAALHVHIPDDYYIYFPAVYLKSILYNLLSNAVKYRDSLRPLEIWISFKKQGDEFVCTVTDNGLGINLQNNAEKLFGIFKRFHEHAGGTGIGLHIIKLIANSYNGKIHVTSNPGKGSTFVITIPQTHTQPYEQFESITR